MIKRWRKSSYSQGGMNNCVEVADLDDRSRVRDTRYRAAAVLEFDRAEWAAFLRAARAL